MPPPTTPRPQTQETSRRGRISGRKTIIIAHKEDIEPDRDFQGADLLWRLAIRAGRNLHVPQEARRGAGPEAATAGNQRLYLNGTPCRPDERHAALDLNAAALGIGRHVIGSADPFNGHIDEFRIAGVQRSDGLIETTWSK
jgi:hypothetical protein